jgi:N-glycosylase/DNA lyase
MTVVFPLQEYDLTTTLTSGQAFRWYPAGDAWDGVIDGRWVRLRSDGARLLAETAEPVESWLWLEEYLALDEDLKAVLKTFPADEPLRAAVAQCRGLRLLRQDPWECLASFILSSTKQIVQIQQCVALLAQRYGEPIAGPPDSAVDLRTFPSAQRLAAVSEADLRLCKMGFRARYLRAAAVAVATGELRLEALRSLDTAAARDALTALPGVGPKIANCVLLFAYGRQDAFPVDVWVLRALRELYFPRRRPSPRRLLAFVETYFGPNSGYAQQYLFQYVRTHPSRGPRRTKAAGQAMLARTGVNGQAPTAAGSVPSHDDHPT